MGQKNKGIKYLAPSVGVLVSTSSAASVVNIDNIENTDNQSIVLTFSDVFNQRKVARVTIAQ